MNEVIDVCTKSKSSSSPPDPFKKATVNLHLLYTFLHGWLNAFCIHCNLKTRNAQNLCYSMNSLCIYPHNFSLGSTHATTQEPVPFTLNYKATLCDMHSYGSCTYMSCTFKPLQLHVDLMHNDITR